MSFFYNFPQHPRYRGRIDRHYYWRLLSEKAAKVTLILIAVVAIGVLISNSNAAKAYRYAKKTNGHFEIFGVGI